jgi:hypothetical protein
MVTFFNGYPASSPERLNGYNFEFNWRVSQISISDASFIYVVGRSSNPTYFGFRATLSAITHSKGSINLNPVNGSDILSITLNIVLLKNSNGIAQLIYRGRY